jgi:hypothetical protein
MEDLLVWNGRVANPAPAKRGAVAGADPPTTKTADSRDPPEDTTSSCARRSLVTRPALPHRDVLLHRGDDHRVDLRESHRF